MYLLHGHHGMCTIVGKVTFLTHVRFFFLFIYHLTSFFTSSHACYIIIILIIILVVVRSFTTCRMNGLISLFCRHVGHIAIPTHSTNLFPAVECHKSLTSTRITSVLFGHLLKWIVQFTSVHLRMTDIVSFGVSAVVTITINITSTIIISVAFLSLVLFLICRTNGILLLIVNFTKIKLVFVFT